MEGQLKGEGNDDATAVARVVAARAVAPRARGGGREVEATAVATEVVWW